MPCCQPTSAAIVLAALSHLRLKPHKAGSIKTAIKPMILKALKQCFLLRPCLNVSGGFVDFGERGYENTRTNIIDLREAANTLKC